MSSLDAIADYETYDDDGECGYSWDHTLVALGEGHWECSECGAEIFDMDHDDADPS